MTWSKILRFNQWFQKNCFFDGMQPIPSTPPPVVSTSPTVLPGTFEEQLARILVGVPKFIRLPKASTRCQYTQLSRTALNELVAPTKRNGGKPPVQAVYQRVHRYAQRGTWLIPAENLFRYLLSLSASSVEEYQEADDLRASNVVDGSSAGVAPISHKAREKGSKSSF